MCERERREAKGENKPRVANATSWSWLVMSPGRAGFNEVRGDSMAPKQRITMLMAATLNTPLRRCGICIRKETRL